MDITNNFTETLEISNEKKTQKKEIKYSTLIDSPPLVVVVQGGQKSGKSTLIKSLIKYYTNQNISKILGSITVKTGKNRRLTFIECKNDISSLILLSKIADIVIVLIDARVGFEMETFEFISLLKNHGFTSVIGVLTHMDDFKKNKSLSKYKKKIKKRFLKDATDKAKLYYLYGIKNDLYIKTQLHPMASFLKICKPIIPGFRQNHPYILADRFEITHLKNDGNEEENKEEKVLVSFFGYVRGNHLNKNVFMHLCGLGDYNVNFIEEIEDPCPIEIVEKDDKIKRTLKKKEKFLYAPFCNINNLELDRKNGYINIPEKNVTFTKYQGQNQNLFKNDEGVKMIQNLQNEEGKINLFNEDIEILNGVNLKSNYNKNKGSNISITNIKEEPIITENVNEIGKNIINDDNIEILVKNYIYENSLNSEFVSNNEEEEENDKKLTQINLEKIGFVDIFGDDIEDNYRSSQKNNKEEEYDLNFLLKNCKQKFMVGGEYIEEESEDDQESIKEESKDKKGMKNKEEEEKLVIQNKNIDVNQNKIDEFLENPLVYKIFKIGSYIRLDIKTILRKHALNFSPSLPLILATLSHQEKDQQMGFLKIKFVKHLWFPKILKTNDPLILSIGWRTFQTTMQYCMVDSNNRLRLIKYTPKFSSCFAICYGPFLPINIAVVAIQNNYFSTGKNNFRICGTGDLIEVNQSFNLVKKIKLIGEPEKIYKKTAYIKNMFNSNLEVARYIGAKIQTVSGIRGVIKKQLNEKPEGRFRATFEDKILKSDIIFLKGWTNVELIRFYNPIIQIAENEKKPLLRTMAELRKDYGIELKNNPDCEYKETEREERVFPDLIISKSLEKRLPFKNKNKIEKEKYDEMHYIKKLGLPFKKKIKMYTSEKEKSVISMIQRLNTLKKIKDKIIKKDKEEFEEKERKKEESELNLKKKRRREKLLKEIQKKSKNK